MGFIVVKVDGSFSTKGTRQFSAMGHGHAHAVTEAIQYLADEVLPAAINQDHQLHDEGAKPVGGFIKEAK